ncbi:hypothetical protein CLV65_1251 [Pseudoscardovia suis]|uniref:Uncharacterized protein n=1 Tax=Pseudoscardovia suis TaxID=987063 RepID=A0A261EQK3_9BIFI|nr:hypothetical protein PSSU_1619 [Pseudoscardovia suis]PJJ65999.1 hypothetical protein CLV65_1251 [Pseudoscardovia suis]
MPREHDPAPSPTNATACHNPNPHNLHPGSTTLHPQPQKTPSTISITTPSPVQGTQHRTLSNRCPRQLISSQPQPAPRAHNIAPLSRRYPRQPPPSPRQPHRGRTTLHPRQQIHALAASLTTLPAPRAHGPAPSTTDARVNHTHHHSILHPRRTIPHPHQRIRASTNLIAAPTCAQGAQPRILGNR